MKPVNSEHLRALKNLCVIKRCPQLGGSLTKIDTFETKHFIRYLRHVCYLGCPLLGGFTVLIQSYIFCPFMCIATFQCYFLEQWWSGYYYNAISLNKALIQIPRMIKSCPWPAGNSRWWGSLTIGTGQK